MKTKYSMTARKRKKEGEDPRIKLKIRFEQDGHASAFYLFKDYSSVKEEEILTYFREAKHQHQLNEVRKLINPVQV